MSTPPRDAFSGVLASSARYADAVTQLSNTILQAEERLNAMPGKRKVSVTHPLPSQAGGLTFDRAKDGKWVIYYDVPAMAQLMATAIGQRVPAQVPLKDASVDVKLDAAPMLAALIDALRSDFEEQAIKAEQAVSAVQALLKSLPKGGA